MEAVRGPARIVRRLEFYKTFYGPVVRLALSVYRWKANRSPPAPPSTSPRSAVTPPSPASAARRPSVHFYSAGDDDLTYAFSKEIPNATEQRGEAKKVLKMARDAYTETPEERRSFGGRRLAESQFELPVPEPDEEG